MLTRESAEQRLQQLRQEREIALTQCEQAKATLNAYNGAIQQAEWTLQQYAELQVVEGGKGK